ncbi:PspC domain-containing protein [Fusibacter bizertensis]|uniref:PspC domain-containing protein n=1 Tax=Fusibacter bizertensis TaxID=1488331 RepID=UPI00315D5116
MKKLCKIESEGKVSGVCAGLAHYFNIDVTVIRLIWLLAIFFGVGSPILIYIIMAIILPKYDPDAVDYQDVYEEDEPEIDEEEDRYNMDDRY